MYSIDDSGRSKRRETLVSLCKLSAGLIRRAASRCQATAELKLRRSSPTRRRRGSRRRPARRRLRPRRAARRVAAIDAAAVEDRNASPRVPAELASAHRRIDRVHRCGVLAAWRRPVPMAHTGSYAIDHVDDLRRLRRRRSRRAAAGARPPRRLPASRSSSVSPTQSIGVRPAARTPRAFLRRLLVGLAEDVAPLGVADQHERRAGVARHRRGDLAGERALRSQ